MKKFCVQSLIIGVGMGMIMTASFNFLLDARSTAPVATTEGLPIVADTGIEQTIGDLKKNLEAENENQDEAEKSQEDQQEKPPEDTKENKDAGMQQEKMVENNKGNLQEEKPEMVRIVITSGMNTNSIAMLLWKEGLISDTEGFVKLAQQKGYTKIFRAGRKEIPKNTTVEEILEILITKPD